MKMLLHSILLLLAIASIDASSRTDQELTVKSQKMSIGMYNGNRIEYAKEYQIGNMHMLTFDEDLAKTAESIVNCEDKKGDFQIVISPEYGPEFTSGPGITYQDLRIQFFHPLQTRMGCANPRSACKKYTQTVCLLGPYSNPTKDQIKYGKPGEHCTNGVNEYKFCIPAPPTSSTSSQNMITTKSTQMESIKPKTANPVTDPSLQNYSSIQRSILITIVLTVITVMVLF
ncbi:unnamed protein product [Caenorhabditis nigoni]